MKIYGLKNCDTCRKAKRALEAAGFEVELQDVRVVPLPSDQLNRFLKHFGAEKLVNQRSTTWRTLSEEERAQPPIDLLVAHPTLMKRPLIEHGDGLYLGWTKDVQETLF